MTQNVFDLFGEIPVTESDLELWVAAIAPVYLSSERSFRSYIRNYNVPEKIRRAKLYGDFDQITAKRRAPFHARLALSAVL